MPTFRFKTVKFAMKIVQKFLRSNFRIEGVNNLNDHPTLFVVNHFTRAETLIVPYIIHQQTGDYVNSLADDALFKGRLGDFLSSLGAVSTKSPNRDNRIIGDLICGRRNWLIYPEGMMVKTKENFAKRQLFRRTNIDPRRLRTGGAILALKSEIYKHQYLNAVDDGDNEKIRQFEEMFSISKPSDVKKESSVVIPVTITYYPLRPGRNIINKIATRLFDEMPSRLREELEIEGNLLLKSTDINIFFGEALPASNYLKEFNFLTRYITPFLRNVDKSNLLLKSLGSRLTYSSMNEVYRNLKINIDHLFCSGLECLSTRKISLRDYYRSLYLTASTLQKNNDYRLHWSLSDQLIHSVADEYYEPIDEIRKLAESLSVLRFDDEGCIINTEVLNGTHKFHSIRQKNPIKVIANELEPLRKVKATISKYVNIKHPKLKMEMTKSILESDKERYTNDYNRFYVENISKHINVGMPFFLNSEPHAVGVVLSHGFSSAPEEVRLLGEFLQSQGCTVYCIRLPGHGTSPQNLTCVEWQDWYRAYLRGYVAIKNCCHKVIFGGFSTGGTLALLAAAAKENRLAGVFSINAPIDLKCIKAGRSVAANFINDLLKKFEVENEKTLYVDSTPENPQINYDRIYIKGLIELRELMTECWEKLSTIKLPSLIVQAKDDPTVDWKSSKKIASKICFEDKTLKILDADRHVIVRGEGCEQLFGLIGDFTRRVAAT